MTLGQLMAALSGLDVSADAERVLADMEVAEGRDVRAIGHLKLARALSLAGHAQDAGGRQIEATADALSAVDPDTFPLLHDLALYLAAEVETAAGHPFGLRCAQRQIKHRWADRVAQLGAMRARVAARRLRNELDRITLQVTSDELTGIGNRRALAAFAADMGRRDTDHIVLITLDVDGFKEVNDRHGHHEGDRVLARIAQVLDEAVRPQDLAVRLGGDEFMLVLAGVDAEVGAERAAGIMDQIDGQSWSDMTPGLQLTVSMGVAAGGRADLDAVWARADGAMYESKRAGGHRVTRSRPDQGQRRCEYPRQYGDTG